MKTTNNKTDIDALLKFFCFLLIFLFLIIIMEVYSYNFGDFEHQLGAAFALYPTIYFTAFVSIIIVSLHFIRSKILYKRNFEPGDVTCKKKQGKKIVRFFQILISILLWVLCISFIITYYVFLNSTSEIRVLFIAVTGVLYVVTLITYLIYLLIINNKKIKKEDNHITFS